MTQVPEPIVAASSTDDAPWGHASGWAQLYGQRRTVSCVVLGLEQGREVLWSAPTPSVAAPDPAVFS